MAVTTSPRIMASSRSLGDTLIVGNWVVCLYRFELVWKQGKNCHDGSITDPCREHLNRRNDFWLRTEKKWSGRRDSNSRLPAPKAGALPG